MAGQPTVNPATLLLVVSLIGGLMAIAKGCDDQLEAKALADRNLANAKHLCLSEREELNERWRDRLDECRYQEPEGE